MRLAIFTVIGGQTFYTEGGGGSIYVGVLGVDEDIDGGEKEDVSEANIFVSKASKLSAGGKIWPVGPWNFSEFMI